MTNQESQYRELLNIVFGVILVLFLLIQTALLIYYPGQLALIHSDYPIVFFIVKITSPVLIFILNNLYVVVCGFISLSIIFKYLMDKKFHVENESLYNYRYLLLIGAFALPLLAVYFYTSFERSKNSIHFLGSIMTGVAIIIGYFCFALFLRLRNNLINQFSSDLHERLQMPTKLFSTDYSINLKIAPKYYINITNPFRGIMIIGGPGSGKSYSIIEPIIDQLIHKGFAALIYDFKFPTLSGYAYAAYVNALKHKKTKANFRVIYFRDIRYSHRCNPLDPKLLTEYATANQAASTILLNINRTWAQKQGEFFSDSAIIILTSIIWYLRCKSIELNKNLCSLAHVIEFASYPDYAKTIEILTEHPEVKNTIVALQSAKQTGAMEQLGGQLGSMQIAMSKLNDKKMLYVMSGSDFTLDINVPGNEQVVILGNDNEFKDTYAPALSLYAAISTRLMNQKNRVPSALIIDEFPTVYIQNYEQLPATARSNKVACIIAMQDLAQLRDAYGQSKEKTITATHGNIFVGSTPEKNTAQFASEIIGKDIILKRSYSNREKANYNISEQVDSIIYPHEIQQLDVGQFVGQVSDLDSSFKEKRLFSNKDKVKKVFAGLIDTVKPKAYYTDNKKQSFKHQIPKNPVFDTPLFNSLNETDQAAFIDKVVTDNMEVIRKDTMDLIEEEYWCTVIWRYLDAVNNSKHRKFIYASFELSELSQQVDKRIAIKEFVDLALQVERDIKTNPSRAAELPKAATIALQAAIEDLEEQSIRFWNHVESENEDSYQMQ